MTFNILLISTYYSTIKKLNAVNAISLKFQHSFTQDTVVNIDQENQVIASKI